MNLTSDLIRMKEHVEACAVELGLDFPEVVFELVKPDELNMVASYGGFPVRYPHWRFGMEFEHLHKSYSYGLSKIYELVINTDPCYAYLLTTNTHVEQKLVMAHVYGHADFFRNNLWFLPTDKRMIDTMANHAARIHRHVDRQGLDRVESFLDSCLSLENLIDPMSLYMKRHGDEEKIPEVDERRLAQERVRKLRVDKPYMEHYINPPAKLKAERERIAKKLSEKRRVPASPVRDVLGFLLSHAPLSDWQADCLDIVREEAYYFVPQRMTKIMNEGWASWAHSTLMTTRLLESGEIVEYCTKHAATLSTQPGQINPYALGLELYKDIEDRWDRGAHGKLYNECDDWDARRNWNTGARQGRDKIFEARRIHNDQSFLDAFLTPDFIEAKKLYVYGTDPRTGQRVVVDRDPASVKHRFLQEMTNMGQPLIDVVDANHANRGELYLVHRWEGVDLRSDFAAETLGHLARIWTRPVNLETHVEGRPVLWHHDGTEHKVRDLQQATV